MVLGVGCAGTSTSCTVSMSANQTVTANYNLAGTYTINGGASLPLYASQNHASNPPPTIVITMQNQAGGQTATRIDGVCKNQTNNGYQVTCTVASSPLTYRFTHPASGLSRDVTFVYSP